MPKPEVKAINHLIIMTQHWADKGEPVLICHPEDYDRIKEWHEKLAPSPAQPTLDPQGRVIKICSKCKEEHTDG